MTARPAAHWAALCALAAAVAAVVFAPSLGNGFVFDDLDLVVGSQRIRDLADIRGLLGDAYRPLRTITYAVDYAIWGLDPTGFRITNIAIHAINAVLALLVARRLTGGARVASLLAALVFAVHPVQVESVAYVSGRRDVLFALFFLAAFLSYARYREAATARARAGWLAAAGAGFVLSLMSKEMAASFPFVCLLWDLYRTTEPDAAGVRPSVGAAVRRLVREGAVLYGAGLVALAAFAYYTIVIRGATTAVGASGEGVRFWGGSALTNTLTVPLTYAHYARLAVWPSTLAAQYYGAFEPASGFADPRVLPALAFLVALVAAALYLMLRTSHRAAGFGIAWFLVTLLPASQIVPHHEIVADHYLYLPLVGLGVAAASGLVALERAAPRWRTVAYGAAAVLLALLVARTVVRERDWRDEATLWEATYAAVPDSPRAAYNYGLVLTNRGEHQRAVEMYRQSIAGEPTFVQAYFNLASTFAGLNRIDDARNVYRRALEIDLPAAARTWHTTPDALGAMFRTELAMLDAQAGDTAGARDELAAIVAQLPNLLRAEEFYFTVLQTRGETASAIAAWRERAAAAPESAAERLVLGHLLWKTGKVDDAYAELRRAVELRDDSALAHMLIGRYYREVRPGAAPAPDAAAAHFDRALESALTPFDAEAIRRARGDGAPGALAG